MDNRELKHKSKFLSLILRHKPQTIGLTLDKNGWANVEELIEKAKTKKLFYTLEVLEEVVEQNNKKRFTFNEDKTKIRANQGHSLNVDMEFKPIAPPSTLYHGTSIRNIDSIRSTGIEKRNRQHVHLSHEESTAVNVGSRHGKPIVLHIDAAQMHEDGFHFYLSKNGVWLTDYIDPKYIKTL
ncbi:MAG: RNA 2'-phosphotransferase [Saprospiraceae bacterium]|nr:RNA 2'-phosphotransferase [Saprospiraceae bacterium]